MPILYVRDDIRHIVPFDISYVAMCGYYIHVKSRGRFVFFALTKVAEANLSVCTWSYISSACYCVFMYVLTEMGREKKTRNYCKSKRPNIP